MLDTKITSAGAITSSQPATIRAGAASGPCDYSPLDVTPAPPLGFISLDADEARLSGDYLALPPERRGTEVWRQAAFAGRPLVRPYSVCGTFAASSDDREAKDGRLLAATRA